MLITGWIPMVLAGLVGTLLFEGLKVLAAYREGKPPTKIEWVTSSVFVVLGALVPLVYGLGPKPFLEVAQLAVGVPALVSGGFRVATASTTRLATSSRNWTDYVGWRL